MHRDTHTPRRFATAVRDSLPEPNRSYVGIDDTSDSPVRLMGTPGCTVTVRATMQGPYPGYSVRVASGTPRFYRQGAYRECAADLVAAGAL